MHPRQLVYHTVCMLAGSQIRKYDFTYASILGSMVSSPEYTNSFSPCTPYIGYTINLIEQKPSTFIRYGQSKFHFIFEWDLWQPYISSVVCTLHYKDTTI